MPRTYPTPPSCSSPGCLQPHRARGWCKAHYMKLWSAGAFPKRRKASLPERFWKFVAVRSKFECWDWMGMTSRGYGQFVKDGRTQYAHRIAFWLQGGVIPEGMQIDHLCRNRLCQNAAHMEPVTPRENSRRSLSPSAWNAVKTHCKQGHEFDKANTYITKKGARQCRTCQRLGWRRRFSRQI